MESTQVQLSERFGLSIANAVNRSSKERSKFLEEYQFLVEQVIAAAQAFLRQDLTKFDPNIGDCACQIRTVNTLLLARDVKMVAEMSAIIECAKMVGQACAFRLTIADKAKVPPEYAKTDDIQLMLSEKAAYLVQAYVFTLTLEVPTQQHQEDQFRIVGKSFSAKLNKISGKRITTTRAESITRTIRANLSDASLDFIRQQADLTRQATWIQACSPTFTQISDCFRSVPMFYSYQILLETCRANAIPILFKVKLYANDVPPTDMRLGTHYVTFNTPTDRIAPDVLYCVFEGVRQNSMAVMTNLAIQQQCNDQLRGRYREVILAGAADHPQYARAGDDADNKVTALRALEQTSVPTTCQLDTYAGLARQIGCSESNRSLFFIQHVYPQLGRLLAEEERLKPAKTSEKKGDD